MANEELMDNTQTVCGECGKAVPLISGYMPWCECGWNLHLSGSHTPKGLVSRIYRRIGLRRGKVVFEKLLRSQNLPREVDLTNLILLLLSASVQFFTLFSLAFGVYFIFNSYSNLLLIFPGLGLLGFAWVARPRFANVPSDALSQKEFPEIHRTVSRVAQALGTSPPDYIVVNEEFNASVFYVGHFQRKAISIGLPLFSILSGQEKIALISHELAHFVNGDPTRGVLISLTTRTLVEWHRALCPDCFLPRNESGILLMAAEFVSNVFFYLLSRIPHVLLRGFLHLAWDKAQTAEYLADRIGAKVSGTDAFVSMSEKTLLEPKISMAIQRATLKKDSVGAINEIQAEVEKIHPREFDRLKRIAELEEVRLDATHPPTAWRIKLLLANEILNPKLTLATEEEQALTEELNLLENFVDRKLADCYLRNVYY